VTAPTPETRRTVTINQACTLTGVSRRTIYNWIDAKKVAYVRTAGGRVRILADTLFRPGREEPAP
jgi:excisionase family DNA binding protein